MIITDAYRASLTDTTSDYRTAVALNPDGSVFDRIGNWQTCQTMASEYRIIVLEGDGTMSRDEIQSLCDWERANVVDAFGPEHLIS